MNKDEIFLIIFLYGLVILIGSSRSLLLPFFHDKRTPQAPIARSFVLAKSPKKNHTVSQKRTRDPYPVIFHEPVSIAQKASPTSRSSRG